jgi:hypothetical protein
LSPREEWETLSEKLLKLKRSGMGAWLKW